MDRSRLNLLVAPEAARPGGSARASAPAGASRAARFARFGRIGRAAQRGVTLIELTVVTVISTIVAVLGAQELANRALSTTGEATSVYLNTLRGGVDNYLVENFVALSNGAPVAGYANPLQPTLAELRATGRLINRFPNFSPFNIPPSILIVPTGCPGLACRLDAYAWLQQPLVDAAGNPRTWLATEVRMNTLGGLSTDVITPTNLSGPTGVFPNPLGNQQGVVGVTTTLDTALFAQYVRRNDNRLTTLNEALTVNAGPLATGGVALNVNGNQATTGNTTMGGTLTVNGAAQVNNNLTVTGGAQIGNNAGTPCVTMTATGVVTIACNGVLNAQSGVFTDGAGNTTTIGPTGVTATGRVTGNAGLATANARLFDAAEPDTIRITGGTQTFIRGPAGTLVAFDAGDVVAGKNIAGQRLSLQSAVVPGTACANTSGAIGAGVEYASTATGGLAACRGGNWVALQEFGTMGAACPVDGAVSVDPATSEGLICRGGRWVRTVSLLSSFVLIKTEAVTDGSSVAQPACPNIGGAFAGVPLLMLQAQNEGSSDATFNRYATVAGANWTIHLTDVSGTPLGGARAIAMSYCLYQP